MDDAARCWEDGVISQRMENDMTMLKKAAISLAMLSMAAAPVAASAASGARALSAAEGQSNLEGNSSWIIGLIGLLAGVTAIVLIADDDEDSPVSPD
jgi:hypothetical protein